jgi:hypothetical protein
MRIRQSRTGRDGDTVHAMNSNPNPTSRLRLLELKAVLRHRSLFCPEYDACLALAAHAGWTSWTCEECPRARVSALPDRREECAGEPEGAGVAATH